MPRALCISIFILITCMVIGQDNEFRGPAAAEKVLKTMFDRLYAEDSTGREQAADQILEIMPVALSEPGAMEYPWDRLDRIGVITSEDNKIRLFTWHLETDPDNFRYFGYVQVALKRGRVKVFPLNDNGRPQRNLFDLEQSTGDWFGKLYYGIVMNREKRKKFYTVMGMDFNDSRSNIKSVEVLAIQRNRPVFMEKMFYNGNRQVDRLVLEYSDKVTISVRFEPNLEMITFDHLVPFHQVYTGNYEFYGPDGSHDGLEFSEGAWHFREDVDARLQY